MECAPVFTTSLFMQPPVQSFASAIFHLTVQPPYLFTKPSQQPVITLLSSTPQTSSQFRLLQGANEQSSLVWNDTVLIPASPWTGLTMLKITNSILLSLKIGVSH